MKGFLDLDTHFERFQDRLTPLGLDLYPLPASAEVSLNLVSMGNFLPLLAPLLDAMSPQRICEIGAYRGISTHAFAELAQRNKGELLVVDPAISPDAATVKAEFIHYFQMLSEEFLATPRNVDVFFIDGDHNYEVVTTELRLMVERQCGDRFPILFMHDTGWPCAYRDMYYDVSRIRQKHELSQNRVLKLTKAELTELEISIQPGVDFAQHEGGPKNGVRPAILDFLNANPGWKFIHLPSLYGLGVVWHEKHVSKTVTRELEELKRLFERISAFLSVLELNRVLLLSEINLQGEVWKQDQEYITAANKKIATKLEDLTIAHREVEAVRGELEVTRGELDGARHELAATEARLTKQLADAQEQIVFAEGNNAAANLHISMLYDKIANLETLKGSLKQAVKRIIVRIKQVF